MIMGAPRRYFLGISLAGIAVSALAGTPGFPDPGGPDPQRQDGARRAELLNMVRQDCGSCHGLSMKGGLGPPLLPESLSGKDREGLAYTVLYGRPGTPMPPWKDFVSETEARWIVDQLLKGLPHER